MGNRLLLFLFLFNTWLEYNIAFNIDPNFASNFVRSQLSMREVRDLTVAELRTELRSRGEKVFGKKSVLMKRLQNARSGKSLVLDEASDDDVNETEDREDGDDDDDDEQKLKSNSFINDEEEHELEDNEVDSNVRFI